MKFKSPHHWIEVIPKKLQVSFTYLPFLTPMHLLADSGSSLKHGILFFPEKSKCSDVKNDGNPRNFSIFCSVIKGFSVNTSATKSKIQK